MRISSFVILLAMLTTPSMAKMALITQFGIGNKSCATWLATSSSEAEGEIWIWGFWSGANFGTSAAGANGATGNSTDSAGIAGEVKKRCMNMPARSLSETAVEVFNEFLAAGK